MFEHMMVTLVDQDFNQLVDWQSVPKDGKVYWFAANSSRPWEGTPTGYLMRHLPTNMVGHAPLDFSMPIDLADRVCIEIKPRREWR